MQKIYLPYNRLLENVSKQKSGLTVICEECDSELIVDTGTCPICGSKLSDKETSENENILMDKIRVAYNLIFCAEYMGIDTKEANELIGTAREEMEIGDFEKAEEKLAEAFGLISPILEKELKKKLSAAYKLLKEKEASSAKVSLFSRNLLKKAKYALENGELDRCLVLLENFRRYMG